jgi:hypothetical protein
LADDTDDLHPYSLEVAPNPRSAGAWFWTLRLNGKLLQRSDRKYDSEDKARREGREVIEKLKHGRQDGR